MVIGEATVTIVDQSSPIVTVIRGMPTDRFTRGGLITAMPLYITGDRSFTVPTGVDHIATSGNQTAINLFTGPIFTREDWAFFVIWLLTA